MVVDLAQETTSVWLAAQDVSSLRRVFQEITVDSCPYRFNFHMHTVCSDGRLQPEQLIEQAIALGLQGLAITDHHSTHGYQQACQRLKQWHESAKLQPNDRPLPHLWTGMEINADLLGEEVHILAYAFDPDHEAIQLYKQGITVAGNHFSAQQVIASIQTAGGLAVLAHPARYRRSHYDLIPAAAELGINGVETYYAYGNPAPWRPSLRQTQEVYELSQTYRLLSTCGTDTHGLNLLQRL